MKLIINIVFQAMILWSVPIFGQGGMIVDQQSTSVIATFGSSDVYQSFTPSLSAINFVQLQVWDEVQGASESMAVDLLAGSSAGPIIGVSAPASIPTAYLGSATFVFPNSISLTPGDTYFIQPVAQGNIYAPQYVYGNVPYVGGNLTVNNVTLADSMSFSEGIIVPEPSSMVLAATCGLTLLIARRKCNRKIA